MTTTQQPAKLMPASAKRTQAYDIILKQWVTALTSEINDPETTVPFCISVSASGLYKPLSDRHFEDLRTWLHVNGYLLSRERTGTLTIDYAKETPPSACFW